MPLCTEADVEAVLRATIDDGDIDDLLDLVSGYLEGYLGRTFEEAEITTTLTASLRQLRIYTPHWPLTSVTSVTEDGTLLTVTTQYNVDLDTGIIERVIDEIYPAYWNTRHRAITVVYTPKIPGDLKALTARIVARIYRAGTTRNTIIDANPELEGLTQMTVGQWSATVDKDALDPAAAFDLNDIDLHILNGYLDRTP